jgi:hypothetical protein
MPEDIEQATGITPAGIRRHFASHAALLNACRLVPDPQQALARATAKRLAAIPPHRPSPGRWKSCGGPRSGAPLNFHGLLYAPTSEIGVVYVFAILAPLLVYAVEVLRTRFPDCIARRKLDGPADTWEQVRIEFEFKSRNFVAHRHDPSQCDLIVCWEHDWPDCPLEVLELRQVVKDFGAGVSLP